MLPRVIVHNAVSADGRIDWFMPDVGLFYELAGRWREDCTLSGSDTLLMAEEEIVPEGGDAFNPPAIAEDDPRAILAVPDSRGRIRTWHHWLQLPYWKGAVVLVSRSTPKEYLEYLNRRHIDAIVAGDDHVDYRAALEELNDRYDVKVVRVDSGGTLNGHLLRAGLVDEVSLLIHPALVGGVSPRSAFRAPDLAGADGVTPLKLMSAEEVRDGIVWLRYEVVR